MSSSTQENRDKGIDAFRKISSGRKSGMLKELVSYIRDDKKYFLIPVIIGLVVMGAIVIINGTPAAAILYTLF